MNLLFTVIYIYFTSLFIEIICISQWNLSLLNIANEIKLFCIIRNEVHIYMQIFSAVSYSKYIYFFQLSDLLLFYTRFCLATKLAARELGLKSN